MWGFRMFARDARARVARILLMYQKDAPRRARRARVARAIGRALVVTRVVPVACAAEGSGWIPVLMGFDEKMQGPELPLYIYIYIYTPRPQGPGEFIHSLIYLIMYSFEDLFLYKYVCVHIHTHIYILLCTQPFWSC